MTKQRDRISAARTSDGGIVAQARGTREYLIRAFGSFPFFGGKSAAEFDSSGWGAAFDIAAFKEALTIVSQFNKNDSDRKAKTKDRATRLLIMAQFLRLAEELTFVVSPGTAILPPQLEENFGFGWLAQKVVHPLGNTDFGRNDSFSPASLPAP